MSCAAPCRRAGSGWARRSTQTSPARSISATTSGPAGPPCGSSSRVTTPWARAGTTAWRARRTPRATSTSRWTPRSTGCTSWTRSSPRWPGRWTGWSWPGDRSGRAGSRWGCGRRHRTSSRSHTWPPTTTSTCQRPRAASGATWRRPCCATPPWTASSAWPRCGCARRSWPPGRSWTPSATRCSPGCAWSRWPCGCCDRRCCTAGSPGTTPGRCWYRWPPGGPG